MAGPEHRTREYKAMRQYLKPLVESGQTECAERICLWERDGYGRAIQPDDRWHLAHDPTDPERKTFLGPAHERCNTSEGATRGNKARKANAEQTLWWRP